MFWAGWQAAFGKNEGRTGEVLGDKDVLGIVGVGGGCGFGGGRTAAGRSPRRFAEGTTERVKVGGK
jgi:hypothetical protein